MDKGEHGGGFWPTGGRFYLSLLIAVMAVMVMAGSALAFHPWNNFHWSSDELSPTVLDKTTSPLYDVSAGVIEWAVLGSSVQPVIATGKKGQITVTEAGSRFWLGLAQVFLEDGHITKGRVKLNTNALIPLGAAAADHVLCQELGHVLSLDHNRVDGDTCMNDQAALGSATSPNTHDGEQLSLNHDHEDELGGNGNKGRGGGRPQNGWVTIHEVPIP